mmetsp:Transcript_30733/g.56178  ORF Transcript_30733/g.56178 Transcript_30733/m.56178 type:complete len:627 (+) Transcript_30733:97-1977(+)
MLQLESAALESVTLSQAHRPSSHLSQPERCGLNSIAGTVGAILFDFDGTLTATPGERANRKLKVAELEERAAFLEPRLRKLREAKITLGIISKSTEATVRGALEAVQLLDLFDGPMLFKAVGLEGKAGFIEELCTEGSLSRFGHGGHNNVLLVDDDVFELERARDKGIQTYAAPEKGGLQETDFNQIFSCLGIAFDGCCESVDAAALGVQPLCLAAFPPTPSQTDQELERVWPRGLVSEHLLSQGLDLPLEEQGAAGEAARVQRQLFKRHYMLDVEMGEGAFGKIKRCLHIATERPCAVKLLNRSSMDRHFLQNMMDNGVWSLLLSISHEEPHPNVVKYLDFLVGPQLLYEVMESLDGPELLTYLQEHAPVTESFARQVMHQAVSALRHVHTAGGIGLIHRDVKLENLRFRDGDFHRPGNSPHHHRAQVVLLDFGLSCLANSDEPRKQIVGTLLYVAPEVFTRDYNTQVDMWSTGVALYLLLTGKAPWKPQTRQGFRLDRRISSGEAVSSALAVPEILTSPPLAVDLLARLIVVDPERRLRAEAALEHPWLSAGLGSRPGSEGGPSNPFEHDNRHNPFFDEADEDAAAHIIQVSRGAYKSSAAYSRMLCAMDGGNEDAHPGAAHST